MQSATFLRRKQARTESVFSSPFCREAELSRLYPQTIIRNATSSDSEQLWMPACRCVSAGMGGSAPLQLQECGQEASPGGAVIFGHCWQCALCAGGKQALAVPQAALLVYPAPPQGKQAFFAIPIPLSDTVNPQDNFRSGTHQSLDSLSMGMRCGLCFPFPISPTQPLCSVQHGPCPAWIWVLHQPLSAPQHNMGRSKGTGEPVGNFKSGDK